MIAAWPPRCVGVDARPGMVNAALSFSERGMANSVVNVHTKNV
jgi:hypothetical protein